MSKLDRLCGACLHWCHPDWPPNTVGEYLRGLPMIPLMPLWPRLLELVWDEPAHGTG